MTTGTSVNIETNRIDKGVSRLGGLSRQISGVTVTNYVITNTDSGSDEADCSKTQPNFTGLFHSAPNVRAGWFGMAAFKYR